MICFVILHYIVIEETINCVDSIRRNIKEEKHIIIVDNASPNMSFEKIKSFYAEDKEVSVIKTKENLGFAKGNNFGYSFALKNYNPDFVVVMNNDMEITQDTFVDEIKKSFLEYEYYIMGPDIFSTSKRYHQNPQKREIPDKKQLKKNYYKLWLKDKLKFAIYLKWLFKKSDDADDKTPKEDNYTSAPVVNPLLHGSCYIFSSLFIEKHQNECFYDKTFMYMEAEILYYLAMKNHEKMLYWPYAKVLHHEDVSTDARFSEQYKKSIFSVKCLLQSTKAFIDLIEEDP